MSDLLEVVRLVALDHYLEQPGATRTGAAVFVDEMLKLLTPELVGRARSAAGACEADYVESDPTPLQVRLRAAIIDRYRRTVRPHPRLEDQAAAFADTIISNFGPAAEKVALDHAGRLAAATEHLMQAEYAREREKEIARNRPRPPRRPLYPV
jgi:hypothetical protein